MSIAPPSDGGLTNTADTLVVLLHGVNAHPKRLRFIREAVTETFDTVDVLEPVLPFGLFSFADLNALTWELVAQIDQACAARLCAADGQPYRRIVLIGHSLGALVARKIYVYACGQNEDAPFESTQNRPERDETKAWASSVERIILMAGLNRGWTISHHLALPKILLARLAILVGSILHLFMRRTYLYFQFRRGAPFITQLRIQWLAMSRQKAKLARGIGTALTIQLLGSIDDLVAPDDNIDLVTGQGFVYLDVPKTGHADVVEMGEDVPRAGPRHPAAEAAAKIREQRRAIFIHALTAAHDELTQQPSNLIDQDLQLPAVDEGITDVIFVIHGIRDLGYWTHKIARKVAEHSKRDQTQQRFATETSSYGYFPMLPFILPWTRRAKVEWLMDQYITDLALYPNADFSFVGHSNGTYLLARALEDYPACHFKHVVFAGSVVRTGYNWGKLLQYDAVSQKVRVKAVLNYVATADWVVALFPKALQTLHLQDLGSAGHDGFTVLSGRQQIEYVRGGHSAAVCEDLWDHIAAFIVHGTVGQLPKALNRKARLGLVVMGGLLAPLVWLVLFGLIVGGGLSVWFMTGPESLKSGALLLYLALVWSIITRV